MIEAPSSRPTEQVITTQSEDKYINVQIDSQILSSFMSCPQKTDYVFNQKLIPVHGLSKSISKGQVTHKSVAKYWQSIIDGLNYQDAVLAAIEEAKLAVREFPNMEAEDALDVFSNLVKFYKFIQENNKWIPVFVEKHFRFIAYEDPILKLRIILTGRIDLGMKSLQQELIPIDLKSEAERWFYTTMSNQFKIYALACNSNILGVQRFGFQKSLEDKDKFKLELLSFDPDILEEWRTVTLPYWVKQLLIAYEDKYWPMNTSSCVHGHFKCQFSDAYNGGICSVSRTVRQQKIERYFSIGEDWNPEKF